MKLKKSLNNISIFLDVLSENLIINDFDILENIINSIDGFKFINRNKEFNELIKIQQLHNKYVLVDFEPKILDEYKYLINIIYNFLSITKQLHLFMLDNIEIKIDNTTTIVIYSTEILKLTNNNLLFSATIRSDWSNPVLVEKILKKY